MIAINVYILAFRLAITAAKYDKHTPSRCRALSATCPGACRWSLPSPVVTRHLERFDDQSELELSYTSGIATTTRHSTQRRSRSSPGSFSQHGELCSGMCFVPGLDRDCRERDPKFLYFDSHPSPDHAQSSVRIIEKKCQFHFWSSTRFKRRRECGDTTVQEV